MSPDDVREIVLTLVGLAASPSADKAAVFVGLDAVEKCVKALKEQLAPEILKALEVTGEARVMGGKVKRIVKTDKTIKEVDVRKALAAEGLQEPVAFDVVRKWVLNPSRVKRLVEQGHLPEALTTPRVSAYLRVTQPKRVDDESETDE